MQETSDPGRGARQLVYIRLDCINDTSRRKPLNNLRSSTSCRPFERQVSWQGRPKKELGVKDNFNRTKATSRAMYTTCIQTTQAKLRYLCKQDALAKSSQDRTTGELVSDMLRCFEPLYQQRSYLTTGQWPCSEFRAVSPRRKIRRSRSRYPAKVSIKSLTNVPPAWHRQIRRVC